MKATTFLLFVLLMNFGSYGQSINHFHLDSIFDSINKNEQGMGCVSLFKNGREVYHNTFGFADIKNNIESSRDTKYRIGSITKTFTAVVIMQLIDEEKLNLATTIAQYFPDLPYGDEITIEELLRHRSGLTDQNYLRWQYRGIKFKLKHKAYYANINYILLAEIAEFLENKSFTNILSTRIFTPCQLVYTFYGTENVELIKYEALSYQWKSNWTEIPVTDLSNPHGAGGIISTPNDVNIFYYNLFEGKLVSKKSLIEMKMIVDGFGIGMMQYQFKDQKVFGHSGGIDGFGSTVAYFPDSKCSITYIGNAVLMPVNDILISVLKSQW
jgi:D-alanyl-D-alanine carboxypeptidase